MTVDAAEHLPLARFLASRYGRNAPDPEGVLEVAVLALLGAARRFDPALGEWGAYASACVAAAVRGEVGRQRREPRGESLTVTMDDGEEVERADLPHTPPLDGARLMAEAVRAAVARLPEREGQLVRLRFGLEGPGPRTLDEVAAEMGLSRSRVAQLEARALRNLRRNFGRIPAESRPAFTRNLPTSSKGESR